jgi:hypothetical protein
MMKVVRKTISVPEKDYVKNCTDTIQKKTISQPLAPGGKRSLPNFVMAEWTPEGQADQTPKSLGLRIIRSLRETFIVNKMGLLLFLERLESILQQCRPKSFSAGPPTPLDLAFPWISITEKEMLTF